MRNRWATVIGLIFLAMVLFSTTSCALMGGDPRTYTAAIDQSFGSSGITLVSVHGVAGSIKVVRSIDPDVIHLGGTTGASTVKLLDLIKVNAGLSGSVLQLTVDIPGGLFIGCGCVDLVLEVPQDVAVETDGTAGTVEASEVSGISSFNTAGTVQLRNVSGPVTVENMAGAVDVQFVTGHVIIKDTAGTVRVQDVTGNVTVTGTAGDVSAYRVSGDLTVTGCTGSVRSGSIGGIVTTD